MKNIRVWCWRDGKLEFGTSCPADALLVAAGPEDILREVIEKLATPCNNGMSLRIAGVALSPNADDALQALWDFQDKVTDQIFQRCGSTGEALHG